MDLEVSETFERTWTVWSEVTNKEEMEKSNFIIPPAYKYRQIVSMGGSRSSKSYSILQILLLEMIKRPGLKITVWRDLKTVCRTTVLEDFQKIIMFDEWIYKNIKYNKQSGSFTFVPTKSRIVFEGADNIGKVLGGTQDISFFNEVTEFKKSVYLQITQRTAERVICDYNPSKNFWLETYRNDEKTKFIHSNFLHNKFCPPNIVDQLLSYEPWESGSYDIDYENQEVRYNGAPIDSLNQPPPNIKNWEKGTADEYMWRVYGLGFGAEKPNKIYRGWREITQEQFDSIQFRSYFGLDFGASNPTACIEVKYEDGAFYICERLYQPLQDIADSLPTVIELKVPQIKKGKDIVVCDSAKGGYIRLMVEAGYLAVGATKGAGSVEVGISLVQGFQIFYVPSINLDFEYQNYSWTIDRYGKSTDVPLKVDDHLMDALRYIVSYLVDYLQIKL